MFNWFDETTAVSAGPETAFPGTAVLDPLDAVVPTTAVLEIVNDGVSGFLLEVLVHVASDMDVDSS